MKDTKQRLSEESESVLKEGIALVLSEWWVFDEAAKEYEGDGDTRRIVDQIHSQIFFWFTHSAEPLDIYDLAYEIEDGLDLLHVDFEPGCTELTKTAKKLMAVHEKCLEGNFKFIEALRESSRHKASVSRVRQNHDDNDDGDDDDDDDDDNDDESMDEGFDSVSDDGSLKTVVGSSNTESNSNLEDMLVDDPTSKSYDETQDGWEVFTPKRVRGKRN